MKVAMCWCKIRIPDPETGKLYTDDDVHIVTTKTRITYSVKCYSPTDPAFCSKCHQDISVIEVTEEELMELLL